jgi:GNAT superfamily N-acetyltransferase
MAQLIRNSGLAIGTLTRPARLANTLQIRQATARDIVTMHRLRRRVRENRLSTTTKINEHSYLRFIAASSAWVAEENGQLVGFAAIDLAAATVWALFVDPAAQGLGVGRALHNRMLAWAKARGAQRLRLGTQEGSRAVQFYKGSGWIQVGLTRDGEVLFERRL